ncbi:MAG: gas vesicle protein [Methylobacterium sp.]|nr:MAG: gas vesicle protein [Methylobacterium sp.]
MADPVTLADEPEDAETLVDLLDRVLDIGVIIEGELVLAVADIDLVQVGLKLFVSSVATRQPAMTPTFPATEAAA